MIVKDHALQIDLTNAELGGEADEVGQLPHRLAQAGKPKRDARVLDAVLALIRGEPAHVTHDAPEESLPRIFA